MSGKGSAPRPFSVDRKTFEDNWDRIFGSKEKTTPNPEATLICPKCGRDRFKETCIFEPNDYAKMINECPMKATAL